ncbi:hypothetical protein JOD24_000764 [Kroppenstedtia sanguinis]
MMPRGDGRVNPLQRGNKLWEGHRMILPEHEHHLWQERRRQEEYRPPELDPDALEAIGRTIERSFLDREPVRITYASKYGPRRTGGTVLKINPIERWILLGNDEERQLIPFPLILDAEEV